MKYNPDENEYYGNEYELVEDICDACNGSGEGMCSEAQCLWCKGWGVQYRFEEVKSAD